MSTQRQSGSMGDELTNILMVGLAALFGLILAIRGAGSVAALVTGADRATSVPSSPDPGPV